MKIKFTDNLGEALSNIEITFLTGGSEAIYITGTDGIVEFFEAKKGDKIVCFIDINDKKDFVFNEKESPEIKLEAPLIDMVFVTIGNEEESVTGARVIFEYLDKKIEKTSDNTGQIILEKVPLNTDVKVYQIYKGEAYNLEINKCRKDKAQYFILADKFHEISNMKFKLVDKLGQIVRNADIRFRIGENEFETITDQLGCVIIENIKVGDTVECKQMIFGKSLPWHKFKCEKLIDEYILHGEKASAFAQNSEKLDSQVRMRFRLVNSKMQPIPNAVLRLEFGINVRNKYTNQAGEAMIEDVMIGDKIKAMVSLQGKKTEAEFICQQDDEMHEIIFKSNKQAIILWMIPVLIILAFVAYFALSKNFDNTDITNEIKVKKDTLIINNYLFYVKGLKNKIPLSGSTVKLFYKDFVNEQITDSNGLAKFPSIKNKLPEKFEIHALGFQTFIKTFSADSIFKINLTEDDSVEISYALVPCSNIVESKGSKTTIKSFKMNMARGSFKVWYNLFDLPHMVEIYNGKALKISDQTMIYSNKGYLTGISNPSVSFNSPDSVITVRISGKTAKTGWVCKVYCARQETSVIQK